MRPFELADFEHVAEVQSKRSTLKEIVDSAAGSNTLRWAKLPEVIQSGLLGETKIIRKKAILNARIATGLLSEEQVALEELKFAALVEEFCYLNELRTLIHLATRSVSWDDPLVPPYHKRAIVNSLHKGDSNN